jgi:hypothetical protein
MTVLRRGKFHEHVHALITDKLEIEPQKINFSLALKFDPDEANKKSRIDLYAKKREILLKLATKSKTDRRGGSTHNRGGQYQSPHSYIWWYMEKNIDAEEIMDEVIHATRTALRAKFCGINCVPPYFSLERGVSNSISLVLVTPKTNLRSIIGDRAKMEKFG